MYTINSYIFSLEDIVEIITAYAAILLAAYAVFLAIKASAFAKSAETRAASAILLASESKDLLSKAIELDSNNKFSGELAAGGILTAEKLDGIELELKESCSNLPKETSLFKSGDSIL